MDLIGTHGRIWPRSAIFVSLVVASVLALGACGGDDEEKKPQSAGVQTDIPIKTTEEARKPKQKKDAEKKGEKKKKKKKKPRTPAESFAQLKPSDRVKAVRFVIRGVLKQFGYKKATVKVIDAGNGARITIPTGEVCGGPDDSGQIEKKIRTGAPIVKSTKLTITVGDSGQSLASYVAAHCGAQNPPTAPGPVVLSVKGTGQRDTKSFRVRRKRWTISYANKGTSLGIFTFEGRRLQPNPVTTQKRGRKKKVIRGKGRFTLKIVGPGPWKVVVYDGA